MKLIARVHVSTLARARLSVCVHWWNNMIGLDQSVLWLPSILTCLHFYLSPVSLPTCPSSFHSPLSLRCSFFYDEEVLTLFRGRLGVPLRVPSKLPFPPRHKVSCILKHPIVSAATTAPGSLEELGECSLYVCCMYAFHSVGVSAYMCKCIC